MFLTVSTDRPEGALPTTSSWVSPRRSRRWRSSLASPRGISLGVARRPLLASLTGQGVPGPGQGYPTQLEMTAGPSGSLVQLSQKTDEHSTNRRIIHFLLLHVLPSKS